MVAKERHLSYGKENQKSNSETDEGLCDELQGQRTYRVIWSLPFYFTKGVYFCGGKNSNFDKDNVFCERILAVYGTV